MPFSLRDPRFIKMVTLIFGVGRAAVLLVAAFVLLSGAYILLNDSPAALYKTDSVIYQSSSSSSSSGGGCSNECMMPKPYGSACTGGKCNGAGQCRATRCNAAGTTCNINGTGAICTSASQCKNHCENQKCVQGAGGPNDKACTTDSQCVTTCSSDGTQCVVGGGGGKCITVAQCQNHCNTATQTCDLGAPISGQIGCETNFDCKPHCQYYGTSAYCIVGGTGMFCKTYEDCNKSCANGKCVQGIGGFNAIGCNVDGDCQARCNSQNQCMPEGTGATCDTNAECLKHCDLTTRQCVQGAGGPNDVGCEVNRDCEGHCDSTGSGSIYCKVGGDGAYCEKTEQCLKHCNLATRQCVPGAGGPNDKACEFDGECATRCNEQNQCVVGGNLAECNINAPFNECESHCSNYKCVKGKGGTEDTACTSDIQCEARCTPEGQCSVFGSNAFCDISQGNFQCKFHCENQKCIPGAGGEDAFACMNDSQCTPGCNSDNECVLGGGGQYCILNSSQCKNHCAYNQCLPGAPGVGQTACEKNADCEPRCFGGPDFRICGLGGTGGLCDMSKPGIQCEYHCEGSGYGTMCVPGAPNLDQKACTTWSDCS